MAVLDAFCALVQRLVANHALGTVHRLNDVIAGCSNIAARATSAAANTEAAGAGCARDACRLAEIPRFVANLIAVAELAVPALQRDMDTLAIRSGRRKAQVVRAKEPIVALGARCAWLAACVGGTQTQRKSGAEQTCCVLRPTTN